MPEDFFKKENFVSGDKKRTKFLLAWFSYYLNSQWKTMPEISRFLGIVIFMNFNDHNPPHFHAKYGDYQITVDIESGTMEGKFPKRALSHVMEWYEQHKSELLANWNSLLATGDFKKIDPLE